MLLRITYSDGQMIKKIFTSCVDVCCEAQTENNKFFAKHSSPIQNNRFGPHLINVPREKLVQSGSLGKLGTWPTATMRAGRSKKHESLEKRLERLE